MKIETTEQLDQFFGTTAYWPGLYSKVLIVAGECFCHTCASREVVDLQDRFKGGDEFQEISGSELDPGNLHCSDCGCDLSDYAEE